jgi:pimeloyl-ACP methyl ester carboxylesterase
VLIENNATIESVTCLVNGIKMNVLVSGRDGDPAMVFLHGFPAYSGVWKDMLAHFGSSFRCYAPDLRGYNLSEKPTNTDDYEIRNSVLDVVGIIEAMSPNQPVVIVGHDFGGFLSYALAAARPELVCALVVMNGPHKDALNYALRTDPNQVEASSYIESLCSPFSSWFLRWPKFRPLLKRYRAMVVPKQLSAIEEDEIVTAWGQPRSLKSMINWYRANKKALTIQASGTLNANAYHISVPHLLIWGAGDPYLLQSCHEKLGAFCDDLEKVAIEDAGHAPYASHPEQVIQSIEEYLSRKL